MLLGPTGLRAIPRPTILAGTVPLLVRALEPPAVQVHGLVDDGRDGVEANPMPWLNRTDKNQFGLSLCLNSARPVPLPSPPDRNR